MPSWFLGMSKNEVYTSHWRHNEHDGVSNHQPHDCLHNCLFRRRSKKRSKLRVTGLLRGIHRWPVNSPHKRPVTQKMFPFDDVIMVPYVKPCKSSGRSIVNAWLSTSAKTIIHYQMWYKTAYRTYYRRMFHKMEDTLQTIIFKWISLNKIFAFWLRFHLNAIRQRWFW